MNEMRKLMEVVINNVDIPVEDLYHKDDVRDLIGIAYAEGLIKAGGKENLSDVELEKFDNIGREWAKNPTGYDYF